MTIDINRRRFLIELGGLAALAGLPPRARSRPQSAPSATTSPAPESIARAASTLRATPQSPNVLFISVDDLNDWASPFGGYPGIVTPNIDRLARSGVSFQHAYCAAPQCLPSRFATMTGRAPHTTGVYKPRDGRAFRPAEVTLPMFFRRTGYRTYGGGKLFHGSFDYAGDWRWNPKHFDPAAWDEYFHFERANRPSVYPLSGLPPDTWGNTLDWGASEVAEQRMPDRQLAAWASRILSREHDGPFFLGVGFYRPHLPWYTPARYFDLYPRDSVVLPRIKSDDLADIPPIGRKWVSQKRDHARITGAGKWKDAVQAYLASISFNDACVGQVLDALYDGPHATNTIVVFWSDHGWHLGEKLHWRKFVLWEEATRVPLIISLPNGHKGKDCNSVVSLNDIYPTLTDACYDVQLADADGKSLLPLVMNPDRDWPHVALSSWGRGNFSLRSRHYRYIRYKDGNEELYDHRVDPLEWHNLLSAVNGTISPEARRIGDMFRTLLPRNTA